MQTTGHTVLITGGSTGIGFALAKQFVKHRNQVIITGRDAAKLARAQTELPAIQTAHVDMTDRAALHALATRYPAVNVLINNAAIQHNYEFRDPAAPAELIDSEIETNLIGPLVLSKLMLPQLLAHPAAAIINVSSGLGIVPKQAAPVYCATKAAIHSFSKTLRWQLEASSIKVFEIIPPLVDTAMTAGRGTGKITPDALAEAFWHAFERDVLEVPIGKTRLLLHLNRFAPRLAERIMRPGL